MSITVVSTLPRPTQAPAADASTGDTAAGDNTPAPDFASLLLGQLQSIRPVALESVREFAEQANPAATTAEPSATAALLAALGLIPQEATRKVDSEKIDETSVQDVSASTPMAMPAHVAQELEATDTMKSAKAGETPFPGIASVDKSTPGSATATATTATVAGARQNLDEPLSTAAVASGTTAIDEQPAKFAAAATSVTSTENPGSKAVSADTLQSSTPPLVSSLPDRPGAPPIRHEASLSVPTPVRDQGWASDFAQKIVWLASNDKQSAQITLNPPQMGPIEIALTVDKGNATASFTSANAEVRNALETALPKLREMFASAGIELGQTNVSAESFKQQAENGSANRGPSQWRSDQAILVADSGITLSGRAFSAQQGNALVDIFA